MDQTISAPADAATGRIVPVRRWHPNGYRISISSSLLVAVAIGLFFIEFPGWTPPDAWQPYADFSVTWILLTYIWVQMGSLIVVGSGTKNQMWIDALTSIVLCSSSSTSFFSTIPVSSFFRRSRSERRG